VWLRLIVVLLVINARAHAIQLLIDFFAFCVGQFAAVRIAVSGNLMP
jgi:hypothetical protein